MSKEKFLKEVARQKGTNTNLKAHKVALSLVGDIDSEYSSLEESYSSASYGSKFMKEWLDKIMDFNTELSIAVDNYVVNGSAYSFQEAADNMKVRIDDLETAAEDIGVDPQNLVSNYPKIKDILSNADSVDTDFRDAYKKVLNEANDRFGLDDFS